MTANKRAAAEPFLNTVARKLGHAAGTLTNVAQELTENLSTLPEVVSNKVRRTTGPNAGPNNDKRRSEKPHRPVRARKANPTLQSKKRASKPARGRRSSTARKKKK
jgi:hypothetical protein